jgi:hypothetical protein
MALVVIRGAPWNGKYAARRRSSLPSLLNDAKGKADEVAEPREVDATRLDETVERSLSRDDEGEEPVDTVEASLVFDGSRRALVEVRRAFETRADRIGEQALALVEHLGNHLPKVGLGLEEVPPFARAPVAAYLYWRLGAAAHVIYLDTDAAVTGPAQFEQLTCLVAASAGPQPASGASAHAGGEAGLL